MTGEPTNRPNLPGRNPGGVPLNDQNVGRANPAPPPPSSLPPDTKDNKILREYEAFLEVAKQIRASMASLNESNAAFKTLSDNVVKTSKTRMTQEKQHEKAVEALQKQYEEFTQVTADGKRVFREGTDFIQMEYLQKLMELNDSFDKTLKEEVAARQKADAEQAKLNLVRSDLMRLHQMLGDLGEDVTRSGLFTKEAQDEYNAVMGEATEIAKKVREEQEKTAKQTKELVFVAKRLMQVEQAAMKQREELRKRDELSAQEREKGAEERAKTEADAEEAKKKAEEDAKKAGADDTQKLIMAANEESAARIKLLLSGTDGGGIFNAKEIGKQLDEFLSEQTELLRKANPDKSENEIALLLRKLVEDGQHRAELETKVSEKYRQDMLDLTEKEVESVMSEEKVSKRMAMMIVEDRKKNKKTEFGREFRRLLELQKKSLITIQKMENHDALALSLAEETERRDLEIRAETKADNRLDRILDLMEKGFFDLKGIFKKRDGEGWFKWILRALLLAGVFAATAYIAFLWVKVKFIASLLGKLPAQLSKISTRVAQAISSIGAKFAQLKRAIMDPISRIGRFLAPIGSGIVRIVSMIGRIAGFVSAGTGIFSMIMRVMRIAWRFVGKLGPVFIAISIIIDLIRGIMRGYERFGGIQGIALGIIAGLVDWLTFGFIGLDNILDGLEATIEGLAIAIGATVEAIVWLVKGIANVWYFINIRLPQLIGGLLLDLGMYLFEGFTKIVTSIVGFIGNQIGTIANWLMGIIKSATDMLYSAFSTLWKWISGGAILGGLKDLGSYIWDKISGMVVGWWEGIANGMKKLMIRIGNALGGLPLIGPSLKKFFHGVGKGSDGGESGSSSATSSTLKRAVDSANEIANNTSKMGESLRGVRRESVKLSIEAERTAMADRISGKGAGAIPSRSYNGSEIQAASMGTAQARMKATVQPQPIIVNSPTTNVVNSRTGGEGTVFFPSSSRNNDPSIGEMQSGNSPG
jgi:hypothetical protein